MSFPSSSGTADDCVHVQWCIFFIRQCDDADDWRIVWMRSEHCMMHFDIVMDTHLYSENESNLCVRS